MTHAADESLAARIRRLEIRAELSDLVARYGLLLDARDWDGAADSFAEAGVLGFHGGEVAGREALRRFYATRVGAFEFTFHYPHAPVFEITGEDRATGTVTGHAEHGTDGTCLLAAVRYEDEYVLEEGRWRFASRRIHSRYFLDWPEFATSFREGAVTARPWA